jgi:hypothetical protein
MRREKKIQTRESSAALRRVFVGGRTCRPRFPHRLGQAIARRHLARREVSEKVRAFQGLEQPRDIAMSTDRTDDLIEALVRARESGMGRDKCVALVRDTFDAPWGSPKSAKPRRASPQDQGTFDKLMHARDVAVSRLASIWNYADTHPADDAADDTATDDDYEAAIGTVISAHQSIHDFLDRKLNDRAA